MAQRRSASAKFQPSWALRWLPWAFALAAIAFMFGVIVRYALPVPWRKNWGAQGVAIDMLDSGRPLLPWLWSPWYENRWFVGRLIDLANVGWVHSNTALLFFQFAVAAAAGVWAGLLARRTLGPTVPRAAHWCLPAIVWIAVSPSSMENWLLGGYAPVFIETLLLLGGFFVLAAYPNRWWSLGVAALWLALTIAAWTLYFGGAYASLPPGGARAWLQIVPRLVCF